MKMGREAQSIRPKLWRVQSSITRGHPYFRRQCDEHSGISQLVEPSQQETLLDPCVVVYVQLHAFGSTHARRPGIKMELLLF